MPYKHSEKETFQRRGCRLQTPVPPLQSTKFRSSTRIAVAPTPILPCDLKVSLSIIHENKSLILRALLPACCAVASSCGGGWQRSDAFQAGTTRSGCSRRPEHPRCCLCRGGAAASRGAAAPVPVQMHPRHGSCPQRWSSSAAN